MTQSASVDAPRLHVDMAGTDSETGRKLVRQTLDRVLGLDVDLTPFYRLTAREPRLDALANRFRGMRPPRFPTVFEALVNGIACQQLSLEAGLSLLNRVAAAFGRPPPSLAEAGKAFPRACDLVHASPESLQALGFSRSKGVAIIGIASAAERGHIHLEEFVNFDDEVVQAKLDELRGVGRWTAEYVLLRGYGRLNVFPGDDIGARNSLQRWLGLRAPLDYERTERILRRWQPYGGLVYLHLLLKYLDEKGLIASDSRHSRAAFVLADSI